MNVTGIARRKLTVLAVLALSAVSCALGQSTFGEFTGTVHDPAGSVVPLCVVKATNTGTSAVRSAVTDSTGTYTLLNMEPGEYELSIEAKGFQVTKFAGLVLQARQDIRQDAHLSLE